MPTDLRRAEPPALPPSLRRPAVVTVAVCVAVWTTLAVRYAGGSHARWLDGRAAWLVDSVTPRTRTVVTLLLVGDPAFVVTVAVVLAAVCLWLGRRRLAVLAVLGPGLTGVVTTLTKPLIGRTINGDFAYPSGHAGGATALGLVVALVLVTLLRPRPARAALLVVAGPLLAGGAVAVLLVAADWHYATDAVGGVCTAVAVVLGSALVLDGVAARRAGISGSPGPGTEPRA